jgi:hypothetical protein
MPLFLFIFHSITSYNTFNRRHLPGLHLLIAFKLSVKKPLKAISDPFASCRKEFDYRMQYSLVFWIVWILHAVANSFWQAAKRNLIPFKAETKGGK